MQTAERVERASLEDQVALLPLQLERCGFAGAVEDSCDLPFGSVSRLAACLQALQADAAGWALVPFGLGFAAGSPADELVDPVAAAVHPGMTADLGDPLDSLAAAFGAGPAVHAVPVQPAAAAQSDEACKADAQEPVTAPGMVHAEPAVHAEHHAVPAKFAGSVDCLMLEGCPKRSGGCQQAHQQWQQWGGAASACLRGLM